MFRNKKFYRWIVVSFFLLVLFLVVGLLLVSYTASLTLFSGLFLGLLAEKYFLKLARYVRFLISVLNLKRILVFSFITFYLIPAFIYRIYSPHSGMIIEPYLEIESYYFIVHYKDIFQIEEIAKLNQNIILKNITYILDEITGVKSDTQEEPLLKKEHLKELNSKKEFFYNLLSNPKIKTNRLADIDNTGFLIKEVYVTPLKLKSLDCIYLHSFETRFSACFTDNLKSQIDLVDFPSGTFYQAHNGDNIKIYTYLNTETITWISSNIKNGIRFAYISPPYNYFRGFLTPFLRLAYINKWIIVAIGGIISVIYTSALKPIINVRNIAKAESKLMSESSKYNLSNAKFGGGFSGDQGTTIGGTLNDYSSNIDYSSKQNLAEAASEIQQLLTQLQTQGYSQEQAQQQAAQDLAVKAQNDPTVLGKLVKWGQSLGDSVAKTTVSEAAKEVFKLALRLSGIPIP